MHVDLTFIFELVAFCMPLRCIPYWFVHRWNGALCWSTLARALGFTDLPGLPSQ